MAPFTVAPVVPEDLPAVNDITTLAFYNNPRTMLWHIFPQRNPDRISAWQIIYTTHRYNTSDDSRYYKLVDDATGKIVAFAVWQVPRRKGSEEDEKVRKAKKERAENELKKNAGFPEGGNQRLLEDFDKQTEKMREKYVDTEKDYSKLFFLHYSSHFANVWPKTHGFKVLKLIAVLPEYQGQGCGRMLIKSGLEIVDAAGARAELEATPQGKPVYERYGFKEVDEIVFELEDYGSKGTQITTCMMRDLQMANID